MRCSNGSSAEYSLDEAHNNNIKETELITSNQFVSSTDNQISKLKVMANDSKAVVYSYLLITESQLDNLKWVKYDRLYEILETANSHFHFNIGLLKIEIERVVQIRNFRVICDHKPQINSI